VIEGNGNCHVAQVQAFRALPILLSEKKLASDIQRQTHFSINEEFQTWVHSCVDGGTAVAGTQVLDTDTAIK
jgi:hypothetical protein